MRFTLRALAFKEGITDERDIFQRGDHMTTLRATGAWGIQIKKLGFSFFGATLQLIALCLPFTFHHHRQAINNHVQKTAQQQAEYKTGRDEHGLIGGKKIYDIHTQSLHHSAKFENRQVHRNHHATDEDTEDDHNNGFHQAAQGINRIINLGFIEVSDLT